MEWYYGTIERSVAEEILKKCTVNSFLIRDSTTVKGSYVVSAWNQNQQSIFHCLVQQLPNKNFALEGIIGGTRKNRIKLDLIQGSMILIDI